MKDLRALPALAGISPRRTATRSQGISQRALCPLEGSVPVAQFDTLLSGLLVPKADPCGDEPVVPA